LSNDEAFDLALDHFQQFYSNSEECRFLINVKTSIIVYNAAYCRIWKDEKQSLTLLKDQVNLYEFIADHPHRDSIIEMYQKIIKTKSAVTNLGINFLRKKEYVVMHLYYSPLINPATQDVIAIHATAIKLNFPIAFFRLPTLINRLSINSKSAIDFHQRFEDYDGFINIYEQEILFLMFYFDTYEDIASVLSLKYRREIKGNTVAKYVRNHIYTKFSVISNKELKLVAIKNDYHKKIPLSLLSSMIVDLSEL
jgi:hypothetical protein